MAGIAHATYDLLGSSFTVTLEVPGHLDDHHDFMVKMQAIAHAAKAGASFSTNTINKTVIEDYSHILALVQKSMTAEEYTAFKSWKAGLGRPLPFSNRSMDWSYPGYHKTVPISVYHCNKTLALYVERASILGKIIYPDYLGTFRLENVQWILEGKVGSDRRQVLVLLDAVIKYREILNKYPALADDNRKEAAELKIIHDIREAAVKRLSCLRKDVKKLEDAIDAVDIRWDQCLESMKRVKHN